MKTLLPTILLALLGTACGRDEVPAAADEGALVFRGLCDASGAVAIGNESIVVADDETNVLRVYRLAEPGLPVAQYPLDDFLGVAGAKNPETDIEGATRVGDTLYWITSHGRSKSGKWRASRYRFFATTAPKDAGEAIVPVGKPCRELLNPLLALKGIDLVSTVGKVKGDEGKELAPKEEGMNIESLCASPDGSRLLLGFRNPRPGGKGLLVPMENPKAVVETGALPQLGEPILLDLGGLGFRAMEYSTFHKCYLIIAGPSGGDENSKLFRWSGEPSEAPFAVRGFDHLNPEALIVYPDKSEILVLSDDGTVRVPAQPGDSTEEIENGTCECKTLVDPARKSCRAYWIDVPAP